MTEAYPAKKQDYTLFGVTYFLMLIGLAIRLGPALQTNFPLNDGGLFYAMIVDLQEAHYVLPPFATYNFAQIPFAYPPLAFYLTGLLADLLHIPVLDLVRLLPPIVSALCIPAFALLAKEITQSKLQIAFGIFAFTLLPRVFAWHIMGGGITRSFGMLFAILTMTSTYRFYTGHEKRLLSCILLGALTLLTHPEATVHTAITALVFYLWKDRSLKGLLFSLGIAAGILVLTSPWWGLVISRHGIDPFLASVNAAGQNSFNALIGLIIFFRFLFADEAFLQIFSVLGLIGLFTSLARKETLLPAWLFIIHLIEPRGGTLYMMLPMALLVSYAIEHAILPALRAVVEKSSSPGKISGELEQALSGKAMRGFVLFLFAYGMMSAFTTGETIRNEYSLQESDLEAFAWVRENTPGNSRFALLTGQLPLRDAWSEWFPVIAERHSPATVFGFEWVNDGGFGKRVTAYEDLQVCRDRACLDTWSAANGGPFDYLLVLKSYSKFRDVGELTPVFENERIGVFQVK